jgi:hypothetical protein
MNKPAPSTRSIDRLSIDSTKRNAMRNFSRSPHEDYVSMTQNGFEDATYQEKSVGSKKC